MTAKTCNEEVSQQLVVASEAERGLTEAGKSAISESNRRKEVVPVHELGFVYTFELLYLYMWIY